MKRQFILVILAAFFCVSLARAQETPASNEKTDERPIRILFIGNSFTYYHSLENLVGDMLNVSGVLAEATRSAPGGWRLRQHFAGETPSDKFRPTPDILRDGAWNFVVLQEQSAGTVNERSEYVEFGAKLCDLIREIDPKTQILLYQTWGRCDGMFAGYGDKNDERRAEIVAAWEKRYEKTATDEIIANLKDGIQGGCATLAEKTGATVVPVGKAFETVGDSIDLYAAEGGKRPFHPSPAGTYLAGCVFFKSITGRSPIGLYAKLNESGQSFEFGAADAATLEKVADETVNTTGR